LFVAGVDSNRADVVDSFPYGRRDAWEVGLASGCDVTPPEAPVILSPLFEEGVTYLSTPVVLGTTEPFARVRVFEGTMELGADTATGDGNFAVSLVPLMSGQHVIHATAVDASGNESASSSTVSFGIQVIDEGNPISGENGKFKIVELSVSPNPFDPGMEKNRLRLTLDVDAVKGLGGDSINHRFFAVTARAVLDPVTLEPITTIYAASEIDRESEGPVRVSVVDEWDGKDEAGQTLENPNAYPSDLSVAVVRLYAGNGIGPYPSLTPRDFLTYEQMSEIMMLPDIVYEWPVRPLPNLIVDHVIRAHRTGSDRFSDVIIKEFRICLDKPKNCEQAGTACLHTYMAGFSGGSYASLCTACLRRCEGELHWEGHPGGGITRCDYWVSDMWEGAGCPTTQGPIPDF